METVKSNLVRRTYWKDETYNYYRKSFPAISPLNEFQEKKSDLNNELENELSVLSKDDLDPDQELSTRRVSVQYIKRKTLEISHYDHNGKTIQVDTHKTFRWFSPKKEKTPKDEDEESHKVHPRAHLTLRHVLLDRNLNVENLAVGEFQEIHLDPNDFLYLPALKTFSWHADSHDSNYDQDSDDEEEEEEKKQKEKSDTKTDYVEAAEKKRQAILQILSAAPNLELIKDFNFETDFELVVKGEKVKCIQNLILTEKVNVENLIQFLEAKPSKVKVLQLLLSGSGSRSGSKPTRIEGEEEDHKQNEDKKENENENDDQDRMEQLAMAIKLLLLLNCNELGILDLSQFCSLVDIQIPHKLHKLHQLNVGSIKSQPSRCLPRNICLNKIFSNLCVLNCSNLQMDQDLNWYLYFPIEDGYRGKFESVQVLVISDQCSHGWMVRLSAMCPNFNKLVVHSSYFGGGDDTNFVLRKVFRYWQHLKHLELRLDNFPSKEPIDFSLDSAVSGLTEATCKRLRMVAGGIQNMRLSEADYMGDVEKCMEPIRASVSNLKFLKTFDLIFEHDCLGKLASRLPTLFDFDELNHDHPPLLSSISCRYGFSRLPNLKVGIIFDQECPWGKEVKNSLDSIACQFISLRHQHDPLCHLVDHYSDRHQATIPHGSGMVVKLYCYP